MKDSTLCQEGIFHEKEEKKTKKHNHSLNLQSRPTAIKVPALYSRAYASGTVTSVRRQPRRSWVKQQRFVHIGDIGRLMDPT